MDASGVADEVEQSGFSLRLNVIYLRELDPELFLNGAGIAPLAVLARGDAEERAKSLRAASALIREQGGARAGELVEFAAVPARKYLEPNTIAEIGREAGMSIGSFLSPRKSQERPRSRARASSPC